MSTLEYFLTDYWHQNGDPRVGHLSLMSSFTSLAVILTLYSLFVQWIGPKRMSSRKAFSLKPLLILYNLIMFGMNGYFLYKFLALHQYGLYIFNVTIRSFEDRSPETMARISLQHLYLLSKIVDLFETVFFVLRKKQSQVTGLHFYHHLTVPIIGWSYFRLCGNSSIMLPFAILNSFIHTVMYAYYGLSLLGPAMQPYLWWKRYLTQIQIIQFVLLFVYGVYFGAFQQGHPTYFRINFLAQSILYIILFTRFYLETYNRNKSSKITQKGPTMNGDINNNNSNSELDDKLKSKIN